MMEDKILCRWFGVEIELTRTEFSLLYRLVKRPRVVYSRDQLLDVCYSDDLDVTDSIDLPDSPYDKWRVEGRVELI